ncbi:MAG: molybdopterin molybdenumtransferase MoeA, partial [Myxococcales bacterium]|nr:molybdopterin molybdenumtransferase MoeA [Myxococcales bacterium]
MTLLGVDEAQRLALAHASARAIEELTIYDAAGQITAAPVSAALDLPAGDVSIMDGYACALATARAGSARVVGESAAGHPWSGELAAGDAVRISTGAVVPRGAAVVIAQEDARR